MRIQLFFIIISIIISGHAFAVSAEETTATSFEATEENYLALWNKYSKNPNNQMQENELFYRFVAVDEDKAWFYFTKETNPAYPSLFKIGTKYEGKELRFFLESFTLGNKDEYSKVLDYMKKFTAALTKNYQENLKQQSKGQPTKK